MKNKNPQPSFIYTLLERFLTVPVSNDRSLNNAKRFLIVRQHNQLGDLLAGVSLFRAIKENIPDSHITLVVSTSNKNAVTKNKLLDNVLLFDKKKFYNPFALFSFLKSIRKNYDVAIVPVVVSISFTSNLIARLSDAKIRIGAESLNGKKNKASFFFDRRIVLDWSNDPDSNVSERSLDIIRPFGINTQNYRTEITYDEEDIAVAEKFIKSLNMQKNEPLIGIQVGAGKSQNRWSCIKYATLIKKLREEYNAHFYLTGSDFDKDELNFVIKNVPFSIGKFINTSIPETAALIERSDLFVTNDTGIMHVAGVTSAPQISIFGPTNPFNWAPIGVNKHFIRKSELIDDVSVDDVFGLCKILLNK